MKILATLLLLVSTAFAFPTLVQSIDGGNATGTFTTGGTLTTSAVGFASPTTSGNTLVLVLWVRQESTNADCAINVHTGTTITTTGFSWSASTSVGSFADNATANHCGNVTFYKIVNATSMNVTTVAAVIVPNGEHCTCSAEFSLYEFSGVASFDTYGFTLSNDTGSATKPT